MSAALYSDPDRAAFHYAVVASVVLHGMLLFGISLRERSSVPEPVPAVPIVAHLVEPAPPPPAPTPAPEKKEAVKEPVKQAVKPPPEKPVIRKPIAKPAPEPERAPAPPVPSVAEEARVAPPTPPAPPIARTEPAPAAPTVVAPPAAPAAPLVKEMAPDPGTLAQYRLQVIGAARKFKRYPPVALDNNWEGDVVVKMAMGANGKLAVLTVQSSSGHKVLDQQALEMFRRASAMVPVPPALRGKDFSFEVRAIYNLKDQDSG